VTDDNFYLIFNAHGEAVEFALPSREWGTRWRKELDTAFGWLEETVPVVAGEKISVQAFSMVVLRHES
jgi:glycogen operon protein